MSTVNAQWKDAVRLIARTPITFGGAGNPNGVGMAIDGQTVIAGNRIALLAQATATDNGIWKAVSVGTPPNWTRETNDGAGSVNELDAGTVINAYEGNTYKGASLRQTIKNPTGFDNLQWARETIVNVLDFGARGDGVIDDAPAIRLAIAAAAGGVVFFPAGTYLIGSKINLSTANVVLRGMGDPTIIKASSVSFNMFEPQADDVRFEDMFLQGAATNNTTTQYAFKTAGTAANPTGTGQAFGTIAGGETLVMSIDGSPDVTVAFVAGDTTLEKVISRINLACLVANPDLMHTAVYAINGTDLALLSPTCGTGSQIIIRVASTGLTKLGLTAATTTGNPDRPQRFRATRVHFGGPSASTGLNNGLSFVAGCDDWTIESCRFELIGASASTGNGYGMNVGGRRAKIVNNTFYGSSNGGRHLCYLGGGARDCLVANNQVYSCQSNSIFSSSTNTERPCQGNQFVNNTLVKQLHTGLNNGAISLSGGQKNISVSNNTIGDYGIYVSGTSSPERGLASPMGIAIKQNTIVRSGQHAIYVENMHDSEIVGNTISDCGTSSYGGWAAIRVNAYGSSSTRCNKVSVRRNRVISTPAIAGTYLHKCGVEFDNGGGGSYGPVASEIIDNVIDPGPGSGESTLTIYGTVNAVTVRGTRTPGSYDATIATTRTNLPSVYLDAVAGNVVVENNGSVVAKFLASELLTFNPINFATTISNPYILQDTNTTNAATAATFTIQSQAATGASSTGGDLSLIASTGTAASGKFKVSTNNALQLQITSTEMTVALPLRAPTGTAPQYGYASPSMSSDANYTLTSSEVCHGNLKMVSGVALTATRSVFAPLTTGARYMVTNLTSGGQSITFIGATGTGVAIANGATKAVYTDGTNYYG